MRRNPDQAAPAAFDLPCACATARRAARAVTQLYDRHLQDGGIEATQFSLLSVLGSIGPCSQATIGRRLALDKTTLSRNLKVLKRRGWIETTAANDNRERWYVLTAAGRKHLVAARPAWRRAQDQLRASMTASDWDAMWKTFRILTIAAQSARSDVDRPSRTTH